MLRACARRASLLSVLLLACGASHDPADAGAPEPDVARTCEEARAAAEGDACAFESWLDVCDEGDDGFCSVDAIRCVDGRLDHERHSWTFDHHDEPSCADGGEVAVDGEGPEGAFSFRRAAGSFTGGFGEGAQPLFTTGDLVDACATPRLVVLRGPTEPGGATRAKAPAEVG